MSKDKWVRRFSVDETARHKNGFTIYKITSVLFPVSSPEAMSAVCVWKRYQDVRRLHQAMRALHAGLHLRGDFPALPDHSYFKRFHQQVIDERAKVIKTLLEFVAEHKLLFTSTDFVNFLQTGYPEPESAPPAGVINAIRSSLSLPPADTPPLEYPAEDGPGPAAPTQPPQTVDEPDFISQIPVYEASVVERRESPKLSHADSFQSINSLDSIGSDLYSELDKVVIDKHSPLVKKNVLPDFIIFDAPNFNDYPTMNSESDSISLASSANPHSQQNLSSNHRSELSLSTNHRSELNLSSTHRSELSLSTTQRDFKRSDSRVSNRSLMSLSNIQNVDSKTKTEDSYVFEAGYMLNLAARYEDMKEYTRAFECYKAGIEKMLIGVQTDSDLRRRALIKEKTNRYLSYAEGVYRDHLCHTEQSPVVEARPASPLPGLSAIPAPLLRVPRAELGLYRVLAVLGGGVMLVLHKGEQACYAMKVIQKVPNNLTEFDEYFLQNTNETRQPILPTVIPYMVPLHAYIETNNLIFLILSYAPGKKLFDYIKDYVKSIPNTPVREVNLENVFSQPKPQTLDLENENTGSIIELKTKKDETDSEISILDKIELNSNNNQTDIDSMDTKSLVINSQNLLKNVDKVLSEVTTKVKETVSLDEVRINVDDRKDLEKDRDADKVKSVDRVERIESVETPICNRYPVRRTKKANLSGGPQLPPGAVCEWGAQMLTALESLHNYGVICRDLNPSNILLGDHGQIILTYFVYYPGLEMSLQKLRTQSGEPNLYIAPELYSNVYLDDKDDELDKVCDFWSFGAIMYELLCGVPLSYYHRSVFTSHTILQLPDGLPLEVQSLLTQLLTPLPSERLGAGGIEDIKQHPYFKHIHWHQVYCGWTPPDNM